MLSWQTTPLRLVDVPAPSPAPGELLVRVLACGVCRTDLHVVDGDLRVLRVSVVPGHQVVGAVVVAAGDFVVGQRVGIAWLRHTCGSCRFCLRDDENLCPSSLYTGWDADGGFAEYAAVPAAYAYALPEGLADENAAPLLCAGIIGYRALRLAHLPPGGHLGIYGFGSSAHITAQLAIAGGASVSVMTRDAAARELAGRLGAIWAGGPADHPPEPLDSAIVFAP